MPFEFDGKAEIKHLNIRKGASDDSQVSVDIKLHVEGLPLNTAAAALGVEEPDMLKRALFRSASEDAEESARFFGLRSITSNASWEDKHAITVRGFRRLRAHKVSKIELVPRAAGRFDGTMQVTIQQPPSGFVENLAEQLNSVLQVQLEHDAELPLEGSGATSNALKQEVLRITQREQKAARSDVKRALGGNRARKGGKRPKAA